MDEASARGIKSKALGEALFSIHEREGTTFFIVPKNLEAFADNLLMISILKIADLKGYSIVPGEHELPTVVLHTAEAEYFAGYVAQSCRESTGPREKRASKFYKGVLSHQCASVQKAAGTQVGHLNLVDHTPGRKLAAMTGFVKEYWSLRGAISALFSSIGTNRWTDESTYLKSKQLLESQVVKRRLPYDNGGVYTVEEILYLKDFFRDKIRIVDAFHDALENPNDDLARSFWERYAPVSRAVKEIQQALGNLFVARARIVFPQKQGSKKQKEWVRKPLPDKLLDLSEDKLKEWFPAKLPGFRSEITDTEMADFSDDSLRQKYKLEPNNDELRYAIVEHFELLRRE